MNSGYNSYNDYSTVNGLSIIFTSSVATSLTRLVANFAFSKNTMNPPNHEPVTATMDLILMRADKTTGLPTGSVLLKISG